MSHHNRCVEPECQQDGIVGIYGAWVCLDHFQKRLEAVKDVEKMLKTVEAKA